MGIHSDHRNAKPGSEAICIELRDAGGDPELQAISHLTSIITAFDNASRRRMLEYLMGRFGGGVDQ